MPPSHHTTAHSTTVHMICLTSCGVLSISVWLSVFGDLLASSERTLTHTHTICVDGCAVGFWMNLHTVDRMHWPPTHPFLFCCLVVVLLSRLSSCSHHALRSPRNRCRSSATTRQNRTRKLSILSWSGVWHQITVFGTTDSFNLVCWVRVCDTYWFGWCMYSVRSAARENCPLHRATNVVM